MTALLHPADRPLLGGVGARPAPGWAEPPAPGSAASHQRQLAHDRRRRARHGARRAGRRPAARGLGHHRAPGRAARDLLTDPLTGLANRALLGDRLRRSLALLRRSVAPIGLLFVDLNEFKAVNDNYGHPAGDRVLSAVSARIGRVLRPQDTLCRWGGDEFVVLCAELDSPGDAVRVAARVRSVLAGPVALDPALVPGTTLVSGSRSSSTSAPASASPSPHTRRPRPRRSSGRPTARCTKRSGPVRGRAGHGARRGAGRRTDRSHRR